MDERIRIMDLVKNGVISSEEAVTLLENLDKNNSTSNNKDSFDEKSFNNDDYLKSLKKQIIKVKERLTVLETLADFERLSDEDEAERIELSKTLAKLEAELSISSEQKGSSEDNDSFLGFNKEEFANQSKDFFSKIKSGVKSFTDNFELYDFNFKVPGLARSKEYVVKKDFSTANISSLNIKNYNGSVLMAQSPDDDLHEEINYRIYGKFNDEKAQKYFDESTQNSLTGSTLNITMNPRISASIKIFIPKSFRLPNALVKLKNGSAKVDQVFFGNLKLSLVNGSIILNDLESDHAELTTVNGSIEAEQSKVLSGMISTVNGEIKLRNTLSDVDFSNVNGSVVLSSISKDTKAFSANVVNGDVKVSIPRELNFLITADTKSGTINERLTNIDNSIKDAHSKSMQIIRNNADQALIKINTVSGSVYLKDTVEEGQNA